MAYDDDDLQSAEQPRSDKAALNELPRETMEIAQADSQVRFNELLEQWEFIDGPVDEASSIAPISRECVDLVKHTVAVIDKKPPPPAQGLNEISPLTETVPNRGAHWHFECRAPAHRTTAHHYLPAWT